MIPLTQWWVVLSAFCLNVLTEMCQKYQLFQPQKIFTLNYNILYFVLNLCCFCAPVMAKEINENSKIWCDKTTIIFNFYSNVFLIFSKCFVDTFHMFQSVFEMKGWKPGALSWGWIRTRICFWPPTPLIQIQIRILIDFRINWHFLFNFSKHIPTKTF